MEDQEPTSIPLPEGRSGELVLKAAEHAVKLGVVANAGGAIGTITVIAASAKNGEILNILALPLALFAAGIVFALLTVAGLMFVFGDLTRGEPIQWQAPWKRLGRFLAKFSAFSGIAMFICFLLGCFAGIWIIAVA